MIDVDDGNLQPSSSDHGVGISENGNFHDIEQLPPTTIPPPPPPSNQNSGIMLPTLSSRISFCLSGSQLSAGLSRIAIEKRRTLRGTCCECFSHLIILSVLIFGFLLSKVQEYPSKTYSSINVQIPPSSFASSSNASSTLTVGNPFDEIGSIGMQTFKNLIKGPLIIPDFGQYIAFGKLLSNIFPASDLLSQTSFGQSFANLLYLGDLHFAPSSKETFHLINYLNRTYSTAFNSLNIIIHNNENDGIDYILNNLDTHAMAFIILREISTSKINYVIRQNYTTLPNTNSIVNDISIGLNSQYQKYFLSGFLSLENAIDKWIFEYTNATSNTQYEECSAGIPTPVFIPFPTYEYEQNPYYSSIGFLLGIAMVMSTMYPMSKLTKSIVEEKETKMRELMKIMGLKDWVHRLTWFLVAFILFLWIAITSTIITNITFLTNSNGLLIFLYFFLFLLSEIAFSFLLSVFFSNSKLAAIIAPVVLFSAILPRFAFYSTTNDEQAANKLFACLLSPTAFAFGADIISNYEYGGVGIQFGNLSTGNFSFGSVLLMLWADFYIYIFLAWYFDQVLPHENGTSKHPLFIFSYKYWISSCWCCGCCFSCCCTSKTDDMMEFHDFNDMPEFCHSSDHRSEGSSNIEMIPVEMQHKACVRIKSLAKRYDDGKVAVRNLSLSMMEDQITCLLGHNGAGKSTTIAALTGLIELTKGDVNIYGYSLKNDLDQIRTITGLCPQQNVLFPMLTVEEHLRFFGKIKGLSGKSLKHSIQTILVEVGLLEKRYCRSMALSGGMKRKLCLAMALIGDPKFVLLDEPTSGMDPYSRRSTWELLQKSKSGRVILLTTHFMDEADTLADRIAIMSEGRLLCSGSSLFLKNKYGLGYLLSISKSINKSIENIEIEIKSIIENAKIKSAIAGEIIFQLPFNSISLFAAMFEKLQQKAHDLGIGSYGISLTTLEQVFITLAHTNINNNNVNNLELNDELPDDLTSMIRRYSIMITNCLTSFLSLSQRAIIPEVIVSDPIVDRNKLSTKQQEDNNEPIVTTNTMSPTTNDNDGISKQIFYIQFLELYRKRLIITSRDLKGFFFQIIFPSIQILLIMLILTLKLNSSGRTIILNGNLFNQYGEIYPRVVLTEGSGSGISLLPFTTLSVDNTTTNDDDDATSSYIGKNYLNQLNGKYHKDNITPLHPKVTNSTILSHYLLNKQYYQSNRMGGYSFGDTIPLNISIDWDWIQLLLTNNNDSTISSLSMGNILRDITYAIVGENYTISFNEVNDFTSTMLDVNITTIAIDILDNGLLSDIIIEKNIDTTDIIIDLSSYNTRNSDMNITTIITYFNNNIVSVINNIFNTTIFTNNYDNNNQLVITFPSTSNSNNNNITVINELLINDLLLSLIDFNHSTIKVMDKGLLITFVFQDTSLFNNDESVLLTWTVLSTNLILLLPTSGKTNTIIPIKSDYTILHNTSSPHALTAWYGELIETSFQRCVGIGDEGLNSEGKEIRYLTKNHPLPITSEKSIETQIVLSVLTSVFILVPLCYIPAAFISFIVKERVTKSKHLQIVSGVSPYLYWIATYLWDITLFIILIACIFIILSIFGKDAAEVYIGDTRTSSCLFCLLITYGMSCLPLCYIYSFAFTNFSTAQIAIMVINFMTGFVLVLSYYILLSIPNFQNVSDIVVSIFRLFPPYNIGEGLLNLATAFYQIKYLNADIDYFDWEITGRNIVYMLVESIGYFFIVLLSESLLLHSLLRYCLMFIYRGKFINPPPRKNTIDNDVNQEELHVVELIQRLGLNKNLFGVELSAGSSDPVVAKQHVSSIDVNNTCNAEQESEVNIDDGNSVPIQGKYEIVQSIDESIETPYALIIDSLIKTYPALDFKQGKPNYAVRGISLACPEGERFGLLGINGAGKTTTLGVLTHEIFPTSGEVYIGGKPLSDPSTQRMLGYCPQVDPLLELMTAYETLWFFGRIRGINSDILKKRVETLIKQTGLSQYAHRPCGTYSGGNKRKLSLAIALIGDPKVLLLDEPSTGMDPEARRHMWNVIQQVSSNRTVILVSHSMEEIEALCTRVGVMVSGRFQCLGSSQHLKGKFGSGYEVEVRCSALSVDECLTFCRESLVPVHHETILDAEHRTTSQTFKVDLVERHGGYFKLNVSNNIDLAKAFNALESNKSKLNIYDYNISQFTLEQVFIKFAREQDESSVAI